MRIRIQQADSLRGLRVLSEIPDQQVGLIEGPNGIGKSLAIQLLRLMTGDRPWTDPQLWESLRDALMETDVQIHVDGLRQGRSLAARFTPESWPDLPPVGPSDAIAEISCNGSPIGVGDAGRILEVIRFAGNEDLQTVARQELNRESSRFDAEADQIETRLEYLREKSGAVAELLRDARPEEHAVIERRISEREKEAADASELLKGLDDELVQLARALQLQGALSGGDEDSDKRRDELAEVEAEIASAEDKLQKVEASLSEILATLSRSGDPQARLKEAEQKSRRRTRTLASRRKKQTDLEARLGLASSIGPEQIAADIAELRSNKDRLVGELRGLDAGSRVVTFIDEISPPLEALIDEGLGDQIVLSVGDVVISAFELRQALRGREDEIGEEKSPARAIELKSEIATLSRGVGDLQELDNALIRTRKAEENLQEATNELVDARKSLGKSKGQLERYDELTKDRDGFLADLNQVVERAVKLRGDLGAPQLASRRQIETELNAILADRDLGVDDLAPRLSAVEAEMTQIRQLNEDAITGLEVARRERDQAQSRIRFAFRQLQSDPDFLPAWKAIEDPKTAAEDPGNALSELAGRAQAFTERTRRSLNTVQTIRILLKEIAKGDEGGDIGSSELADTIYQSLNERLRGRLSSHAIAEALFEGEELRAVDLRRRTVRWGSGEKQTVRPIESFSTGEQAFAFTQARILALEELPEDRDRLLALDEFGAFVAANRRGLLADFLDGGAVRARASQVLVILPLRSNYQDELPETRGRLKELYERRIEQLESDGYIAEPFRSRASP